MKLLFHVINILNAVYKILFIYFVIYIVAIKWVLDIISKWSLTENISSGDTIIYEIN